jgi:hypothetical protein
VNALIAGMASGAGNIAGNVLKRGTGMGQTLTGAMGQTLTGASVGKVG